jgi:hypothetical protein
MFQITSTVIYQVPLLRHDIYAPTLTGSGANSHLLHDLDRISLYHVKDVRNTMFYEDLLEVVLVGHSYGYRTDLASGASFRQPMTSSMLGITDPEMSEWIQGRKVDPAPYSTYEDPPTRF